MRVALLYGGRSTEHEVSLSSASGVLAALLSDGDLEVEPIGLTRDGRWFHQDLDLQRRRSAAAEALSIVEAADRQVVVMPAEGLAVRGGNALPVDCVIPILHGSFGEDGTLQGLLEMAALPYVGSGVVGSSVGMDKLRSKQLWEQRGLPVVPYLHVQEHELGDAASIDVLADRAEKQLGFPLFVKPNAAGSSVGITRVRHRGELPAALTRALAVDSDVLIEQALSVREIETAVLGNEHPRAFRPGEVIPNHEFYDYDAKYEDPDGARLEIPAQVPDGVAKAVMDLAVEAFRAVAGAGLARVDVFYVVDDNDAREPQLYLNEINTIPGFTPISMYPKMVEAGGIPYPELLKNLIDLAIQRFESREARNFAVR